MPGGIYSDLYDSGLLEQGGLFYRFNDANYRWVAYQDWIYRLEFDGGFMKSDYRFLFVSLLVIVW